MRAADIRFSVAPMMDWTDRHCRYFHRLLTRHARLYTEMLTTGAVIHGNRERLLGYDAFEQPLALQLGGSNPADLAQAARIVAAHGYSEINLNVGCPSDRVQNGAFGACLMLRPALVGDCVRAMKDVTPLPVTVKCRIGVDDQEPRRALFALVENCVAAEVDAIIVHARKAWLKGLSPRENRDTPPLDYGLVHEVKRAFPTLPIAINGGLKTLAEAQAQLDHVDGVMLGRAAYQNPGLLLDVDPILFDAPAPFPDCFAVVDAMIPYIDRELARGERLAPITRHMLGLFPGQPGARLFRRRLTTDSIRPGAGVETLRAAVAEVSRPAARSAAA
jgi:tRNA-dihydrouridine synthase A